MYPYFLFAAIHLLNRPRFSLSDLVAQSAETVHLIRRSWVRFPPRSKDFFSLLRVVPWFPFLGLTPSGLFMGSISTLIYNSELILCSTFCVHSATRHSIHMYPYFLFAAIRHLKSSPTFSVRPLRSVGRDGRSNPEVVGLIPTEAKDFFFASCGSLIPFTGTNAQWVIHGFI